MKYILFLIFLVSHLKSATIVRGPYLDYLSSNSATIRYSVDSPEITWFSWGEFPKCNKYLTVTTPKKNQYVNIYGLKIAKKYCYMIYLPVSNSTHSYLASSATFTTFYDETVSSFSFIVIGNTFLNSPDQNIALSSAIFSFPDINFIIHTGNISNGNLLDHDTYYFMPFSGILKSIPFFISLGLKEYGEIKEKTNSYRFLGENFSPYYRFARNGFSPHYYFIDSGTSRFIFLDNNNLNEIDSAPSLRKGTKQYQWLEETLKYSNSKKWRFVVLNHPIYPSSIGGEDIKEGLEELFLKYKVDFVFQSGNKYYLRTKPLKYGVPDEGGVIYITVGGGDLYLSEIEASEIIETQIDSRVFLNIKIDERKIDISAFDCSMNLLDRFVYSKY
ncbi:MAG: metallophosphoesterase [Elusimicrobiota bacterium]